ncbi:uncharacterized protein LOC134253876 [Saccostrea cucullata]|uniref:uncharacterized protein LOC134253876 n=1 Tax=Saccostrea cuccullata TaxID=36930 RepID=UPI002ED0BA57
MKRRRQSSTLWLILTVIGVVTWVYSTRVLILKVSKKHVQKSGLTKSDVKHYLLRPQRTLTQNNNRDGHYFQVKQNKEVYNILHKEGGFFVDIGAHDGQFLSNTLWLERRHNWTGLLIEANPDLCYKIDQLKRNAWRLCACVSSTQKNISFIKSSGVGGIANHIDKHHIKTSNKKNTIIVPCFSFEQIFVTIGVNHIDFYALDIEGAEMAVLESMKSGLKTGTFTVDVWSIEYRVWDGQKIVVEKSKKNLKEIRDYFKHIRGYFEHLQLSTGGNGKNRYALDLVFVRISTWCKTRDSFPNGTSCPGKEKVYNINKYLKAPHPYRKLENADHLHSQAKQDQVVYEIVKKDRGFFVDIGAYDGRFLSNTLWLERKHNWTGLLIEANPGLCLRIDQVRRHAWRMCACLSNSQKSVSFIRGDTIGGVEQHIDKYNIKMLNKQNKVVVPCFSLEEALNIIKVFHIDFYSLDVEGAELAILESLKDGLRSKRFTVDVWTIEYRVWDGQRVIVDKSLENLYALRKYFQEIGGYSEHSQLSNDGNFTDGYALDVVFVRNEMWCKSHEKLTNGALCSKYG